MYQDAFCCKIWVVDGWTYAKREPLLECQFTSAYFGHSVVQFWNLPFNPSLYFSLAIILEEF